MPEDSANNLSNELTGFISLFRRMRIAQSVCQLLDFRLSKDRSGRWNELEMQGVRNFALQRGGERQK
jgi:hypothetical protein